jgi:hypothetical protein
MTTKVEAPAGVVGAAADRATAIAKGAATGEGPRAVDRGGGLVDLDAGAGAGRAIRPPLGRSDRARAGRTRTARTSTGAPGGATARRPGGPGPGTRGRRAGAEPLSEGRAGAGREAVHGTGILAPGRAETGRGKGAARGLRETDAGRTTGRLGRRARGLGKTAPPAGSSRTISRDRATTSRWRRSGCSRAARTTSPAWPRGMSIF